jgi:hypothetical protein
VEYAFGLCLLDKRDCFQQSLFGPFSVFSLNCHGHSFNRGLHGGSNVKVAVFPACLALFIADMLQI